MSKTIALTDATELIWQEAGRLDRHDYEDWLDMWAEDGLYIVPIDKGVEDFEDRLNYAYDGAKMRKMRVARLKSSFSMSALTAATTVRTISRFEIMAERDGEVDIKAAQIIIEHKRDKNRIIAADLDYTLRRTSDGLKLVKKVIWLVNSEDAVTGMAYLL